jgi:hypothetical protein
VARATDLNQEAKPDSVPCEPTDTQKTSKDLPRELTRQGFRAGPSFLHILLPLWTKPYKIQARSGLVWSTRDGWKYRQWGRLLGGDGL